MNEQKRIQELLNYKILETPSEKELDDLAEIASAICDTPISLITFIDENRQWFKAKKGVSISETPRNLSFCQHTLHNPKTVLVVEDPLNDDRFKDHPMVKGMPYIRFYAGAPLETPNGNVLGTLCIVDSKQRRMSEGQKKALMLLARKVMDFLNTRRVLLDQKTKIELSAARLKKLTDLAPGAICQFEMKQDKTISFPFVSKGIADLLPSLNPQKLKDNPEMIFNAIHSDDLMAFKQSMEISFLNLTNWNIEYRVVSERGDICWCWVNAKPEKKSDGTIVWYGTFQNITKNKEYIKVLEKILFDISHIMRRPVATMLGLTAAMEGDVLNEENLEKYIGQIKTVSKEMDEYLKKLNEDYHHLRSGLTNNS